MQFGIFTIGDVTTDPTNGTTPTEHDQKPRPPPQGDDRARPASVCTGIAHQAGRATTTKSIRREPHSKEAHHDRDHAPH